MVSGAGDGFVKVWSPVAKTCLRTLQGHHGSVLTLIAGAGVVISGSRDSTVKVRRVCVFVGGVGGWGGGKEVISGKASVPPLHPRLHVHAQTHIQR